MNDRRIGIYSPQLIAQWERLAGYLSVALSKFLTDEALRVSDARYRSLFETIQEAALFFEYVLDENGEVTDFICRDINPAGLVAMGYGSKEEITGSRMSRFDTESTLSPEIEDVIQMRNTGKPVVKDRHMDAEDRDYITAIIPMDNHHFILTCRDESEIKGMQRAADAAASRLRAIMDVLPVGLIITDEKGGIISFNEIARHLWGGDVPMVENAEGYIEYKAWWHDTGVEVRADEWGAAVALREGRTVLGQIVTNQGFDGVRRSIVNSAAPIKTSGGRIVGAVATMQDITESMVQEESLRIANGKLKLLDSINRHDIKNQLLVLRGNLELVSRSVTDPEDRKRLEAVERSAEMIEKQVNFAKQYQELGRTSPVWQSLTKELAKAYNGYYSVDLSMCVDHRCEVEVLADPLLPKVFHNLMENTLRYGNRPGRIDVHCERSGTDMLIVYEDRGQGIPVEEKKKVFEKGFGKGTGLGLFLIREILSITGIDIQENGVPGQGIRFEMRVPQGRFRIVDQPPSPA
jgi:signal transduction histidine kinase